MLASLGVSSPHLLKNCLFLGLASASFHATSISHDKRANKFGSGLRDGHKEYVNYTKRKRRAAEKRDLLKWRCCEIHYGNFEELYWSSGMSRKKGGLGHRNFEGNRPNYFEGYRKQKRSSPEAPQKGSKKSFHEFWRRESFSQFWDGFFEDFRFAYDPFPEGRKRATGASSPRSGFSDDKKVTKEAPTIGSPSDRKILGLPPSGSLTIEELKKAFRASALKWHPDRHEDVAKANAEARFKDCGAAYKSLLLALAKYG